MALSLPSEGLSALRLLAFLNQLADTLAALLAELLVAFMAQLSLSGLASQASDLSRSPRARVAAFGSRRPSCPLRRR